VLVRFEDASLRFARSRRLRRSVCLDVAVALGYVEQVDVESVRRVLTSVVA
jgi:hypothetical protein